MLQGVECNAASCRWGVMLAAWGEDGVVVHGSSSSCFGLGGAVAHERSSCQCCELSRQLTTEAAWCTLFPQAGVSACLLCWCAGAA